MFKLLRNRKGVTLVEVLAVVVILGIIAAIAVPTIGNLIENQRTKAAETEWANVLDAARLYATSEDPGAAFTLDDISPNQIDISATVFSEDAEGTTIIDIVDITFDASGNLTYTDSAIYLDGYEVEPA
ncbi:MAG: prepilin-type N-terminal cleavage/methylation domain-containing protein [Tenericutes bacterium]|jgi:type IV pilus assembly protein PilA|nr:prepilin-type N-terminal cleavage/methylation domain-containing protein [Mycoplasmatota bacterium]